MAFVGNHQLTAISMSNTCLYSVSQTLQFRHRVRPTLTHTKRLLSVIAVHLYQNRDKHWSVLRKRPKGRHVFRNIPQIWSHSAWTLRDLSLIHIMNWISNYLTEINGKCLKKLGKTCLKSWHNESIHRAKLEYENALTEHIINESDGISHGFQISLILFELINGFEVRFVITMTVSVRQILVFVNCNWISITIRLMH